MHFEILVAHATPPTIPDLEDGGVDKADGVSVLSGHSDRSKTTSQLEADAKLPWYRGLTCKDLKDIMPTFLILLGGILIMIFVIPYAFSSVIKQLNVVGEMDRIMEEKAERQANATAAAAAARAAAANASESTPDDSISEPESSRLLSSETSLPFTEDLDT